MGHARRKVAQHSPKTILAGPDGICHGDTKGDHVNGSTQSGSCDCGEGVSCGEYLWDHRNGSSVTTWLTETYIGGKQYGLGNPNVDGL